MVLAMKVCRVIPIQGERFAALMRLVEKFKIHDMKVDTDLRTNFNSFLLGHIEIDELEWWLIDRIIDKHHES